MTHTFEIEAKDCPFCQIDAVEIRCFTREGDPAVMRCFVECQKCGATGPRSADRASAVARWNWRPMIGEEAG